MAEPLAFGELLEQLAAPTPAPGGGSAAAAAGALAAALVEMATGITAERSAGASRRPFRAAAREARAIRRRCEATVVHDAQVYEAARAARRALRTSPDDRRLRRKALAAQLEAAAVPLKLGEDLLRLLRSSGAVQPRLHPPLEPDFLVATALARAALLGAAANVVANLRDLGRLSEVRGMMDRYARLQAAARPLRVRLPNL